MLLGLPPCEVLELSLVVTHTIMQVLIDVGAQECSQRLFTRQKVVHEVLWALFKSGMTCPTAEAPDADV
jgi:hypothetical protein